MITEVIRYKISPEEAERFEESYRKAEAILQKSPYCLGYQLLRGVEQPENWILLLQWDSVTGHEEGFRKEASFRDFLELVRPFLKQIEEMKHYEMRKMQWSRKDAQSGSK